MPSEPAALAEDHGWVLLSIKPRLVGGYLEADAEIRNNSHDDKAMMEIRYVTGNRLTHRLVGAVNGMAPGKTETVDFSAFLDPALPSKDSRLDFRVEWAYSG